MATAIIHKDDRIVAVIKNATRAKNSIKGDKVFGSKGLSDGTWTVRWVDDAETFTPIYDEGNFLIGYEENASAYAEISDRPEMTEVTQQELSQSIIKLNELAGLSFEQLDTYITNNVDFTGLDPSFEAFIRKLSRVVLGQLKVFAFFKS